MRLSKKIGLVFAAAVIIVAALVRYLFVVPAIEPPLLQGKLQRHAFSFDGLDRAFLYYLPAELRRDAPAVLALHGSGGSGERIRQATAYAFDLRADQHGFIVVYPEAYEKYWNDCRATGDYAARQLDVNDTGYIRSLLAFLQKQHNIDPGRVFAVGYSDGGHTIPHPDKRFPRFLGSTNRDFSAADEVWRFFQRELDRPDHRQ